MRGWVTYLYDFLENPTKLHLEFGQLLRQERAVLLLSPMSWE